MLVAKTLDDAKDFISQVLVKVRGLKVEGVEDGRTAVSLPRRLFQLQ